MTRPWRRTWIVAVALYALAGASCIEVTIDGGTGTTPPPVPEDQGTPTAEERGIEAAVAEQINAIRAEHGLEPLAANETLAQVARDYSCRMAREDFFSHVAPAGDNVGDRVQHSGVRYQMVGENLAMLTNAPEPASDAVEGWMESEGHRENILGEDWEEAGVGVCRDGPTYYLTHVFMVPR